MSAHEKKTCFSLLLSLYLVTNPGISIQEKHCGKLRNGLYILCSNQGLKHGLLEWKRQKGLCDRPGRAAAAGPLRPGCCSPVGSAQWG